MDIILLYIVVGMFVEHFLGIAGKITEITCGKVDAVGYVYREDGETHISFNSDNNINAGSRCDHLKGQDMVLDWSKIFVD